MMHYWLAISIFVLVYIFIISEKIHRTIISMAGAALIIALGVVSQEQAFAHIDFNTIGLLIGMMIMVGITRQSGVFEYLAIKSAKLSGGKPLAIMATLAMVTALSSALLDNVTTVLLIVPVTYAITDRLDISPIPFLFAEIIASNIGGTATLIGDPPNIMIGSATGLGFMDFLANLAFPVIVILIITIAIMVFFYRKQLDSTEERIQSILELNEKESIKDWRLLKQSLGVLGLTMLGFLLHQTLHLESATIALLGAGLLMLISNEHPEEVLLNVEWPTIFFFAGLFVLVGGLVETGVIEQIAQQALIITDGNLVQTGMLVLWLSAIASAFVDNIPFVATMIPLLQTMGQLSNLPMEPTWWALALGACLGGNGTLIGASANVIVAGIAERNGDHIGFISFLKVGFPLMLLSIVISMVYLYVFFWM
ncbi:MAG: ArsB/NhaD family transporter [Syntrophomonadaceae bacterium]|nr:ArsB/NhaD family transporter [Syntrophomonadaceae bacterium]